jgi:acyl-CoA-binding protein
MFVNSIEIKLHFFHHSFFWSCFLFMTMKREASTATTTALVAVAASLAVTGALYYLWPRPPTTKASPAADIPSNETKLFQSQQDVMRDALQHAPEPEQLEAAFSKAVDRINQCSIAISSDEQLVLYGLYKQVTCGNAPAQFRPKSFNLFEEQAKYAAWSHCRDMTKVLAMDHYIEAVEYIFNQANRHGDDDDDDFEGNDHEDGGGGGGGLSHAVSRPQESGLTPQEPGNDDLSFAESLASYLRNHPNATDNQVLQQTLQLLDQASITLDKGKLSILQHCDDSGQTIFHLLADTGSLRAIQVLAEQVQALAATPEQQRAWIHATDDDGISILQTAVAAGHVPVVEYLLRMGANPDQADLDGETPRTMAEESPAMKRLFANVPTR